MNWWVLHHRRYTSWTSFRKHLHSALIPGLHESRTCCLNGFWHQKTEAWWWAICLEGCLPAMIKWLKRSMLWFAVLLVCIGWIWLEGSVLHPCVLVSFLRLRLREGSRITTGRCFVDSIGSSRIHREITRLVRDFTHFQQNLDWWSMHCTGI